MLAFFPSSTYHLCRNICYLKYFAECEHNVKFKICINNMEEMIKLIFLIPFSSIKCAQQPILQVQFVLTMKWSFYRYFWMRIFTIYPTLNSVIHNDLSCESSLDTRFQLLSNRRRNRNNVGYIKWILQKKKKWTMN